MTGYRQRYRTLIISCNTLELSRTVNLTGPESAIHSNTGMYKLFLILSEMVFCGIFYCFMGFC